jgi:hypothetical protein
MKKFLQHIILASTFICFALAAKSQQVGLVLAPQGTQPYTAGVSFQVYANYNYSNITGNVVIEITYNPTLVSFCGSPAFPYTPATTVVNATTNKITYTFPAASGNNQTGVIMMCFSYLCPSTCFGTNIASTINGTISAPAQALTTTAAPASILGKVINNWTGFHVWSSFIQSSYEVTFKIAIYNGNCFTITNPVFYITPSMGTLVSVTNGLISGSTFTPTDAASFTPYTYHEYYYTLKLPCSTPGGTTITSNVVLKGTNCGNPNQIILTYAPASYTLPAAIPSNPSATLNVVATSSYFRTDVTNNGNTPLNLVLTNNLPNVNTTSIYQGASQPSLTSTINYFNCSLAAAGSSPLLTYNQSTPVSLTYLKRAVANINNLLPGHSVSHYYFYNLTNSCVGVPTQSSYQMTSTLTYSCTTTGLSQVCYNCGPGTGTINDTAAYALQPIISCNYQNSPANCLKPGDTVNLCLSFSNAGSAPLTGGQINYGLQNFLTYLPGSDVYTGFSPNPTYVPSTSIKWNIPTIPVGSTTYSICFKAVVNSNAPYGSYNMNYSVTGNSFAQTLYCYHTINICALPKAEVEKMVKGDLDAVFGTSGNATPGSTVNYQITVKNTGNTTIGNIVLMDRLPFVGDQTIMTCSPRNSQFALFPSGTVTVPGATVQYSPTPNHKTGWPTTAAVCNMPANTWSNTFSPNNLKIALTSNIAPGNTFTFTIPVVVPANANVGDLACNTIGMICDLIDNANNASQMNPVESNKVCVEVKTKDIPPSGCCKDFLKKIEVKQVVKDNVLSVNATMTVGPAKLTKASVSLVDFHVLHAKDCGDACLKDPKNMGNITSINSSMTWNNLPANVSWSHLIQWKDSAGVSWNNGIPLSFQIPLPPKSAISCCCDTILYCLKYSFTDTACITCDTIICYKAYNGKECGTTTGGGQTDPPQCNCSWDPNFNYEGAPQGGKPVSCGGSLNLKIGNIPVTFNPGFQCTPSSATCQPSGLSVQLVNNTTNASTMLTGPGYSHTFLTPGSYTYKLSGVCGGKKCECSITVIITD